MLNVATRNIGDVDSTSAPSPRKTMGLVGLAGVLREPSAITTASTRAIGMTQRRIRRGEWHDGAGGVSLDMKVNSANALREPRQIRVAPANGEWQPAHREFHS